MKIFPSEHPLPPVDYVVKVSGVAVVTFFLMACGGGGGGGVSADSGDSANGGADNGSNLSLADIERYLLSNNTVSTDSLEGVWLLAQERDANFSSSDTRVSTTESGARTLMRTDLISVLFNGGYVQLYYCSNLSQLMFESRLVGNSQFSFNGDDYFFPGRGSYQASVVGNGSVIEFSPTTYQSNSGGSVQSSSETGNVLLKAYKLRAGFANATAGEWQRSNTNESIVCGSYSETTNDGQRTIAGVTSDFSDRTTRLSFRTTNTTVSLTEFLENNVFSHLNISEVTTSTTVQTENDQSAYSFVTLNPLEYEGEYTIDGQSTASFSIDLRQ